MNAALRTKKWGWVNCLAVAQQLNPVVHGNGRARLQMSQATDVGGNDSLRLAAFERSEFFGA